ncbi:MAG: YncE family protein [Bacteroidetes bacterium]|nr:YncE family protein [Bacteroidota bacterium]MCY4204260.1 YncE family protein [Bacteroidota bacterium]
MLLRSTIRAMACMFLMIFAVEAATSQIYSMYVANESDDTVMLVEFDGQTLSISDTITVGTIHTEIEGPHGLAVDPEGNHWYVSIAHGQPNGRVVRYSTTDQRPTGTVELGLFPASMSISSHTGLLHVVNFNLHGDPEPSSVSVVDPNVMVEVGRITTGVMPHGSAFGQDGRRHYSVAMMDHNLIEIDALSLRILRSIPLGPGTKPTWVALHPHQSLAYVAGNGSNEIIIVDTDSGTVSRRISVSGNPYNLAISSDGSALVATLKGAQEISIIDLLTELERTRIPTSRPIPHGVVITPDNKYAFVTSEGIGSQPGTVDAIDLDSAVAVGSIAAGQQTGGIAFWKIKQ